MGERRIAHVCLCGFKTWCARCFKYHRHACKNGLDWRGRRRRQVTWLEEHQEAVMARYAAEDGCTVEEWKQRAVYYVLRQRWTKEPAEHRERDIAAVS